MNRNLVSVLIIALLISIGSVPLAPASAAVQARKVDVGWVIVWLGLPVIRGRFRVVLDSSRYEAWMSGKTTGVFDLLLRVRISQHVRGRVTNGAFLPNSFQHVFRNRRKKREAHLTWGPDRSLHTQLIPPVRKGREKVVPMGMRRSTVDPITAMLTFITQPMTGSPCNQTARVFEGRRRVNARLLMVKTALMPSTYLSGLPAAGRHCHLFADRLAGFGDKHMRRYPNPLAPADMWFAKLPQHQLWLPARIGFGTRFGRFRIFLTDLKVTSQ
jgi:hypothetical protein